MGERYKTTDKDGNEGVVLILEMAVKYEKRKYYLCQQIIDFLHTLFVRMSSIHSSLTIPYLYASLNVVICMCGQCI